MQDAVAIALCFERVPNVADFQSEGLGFKVSALLMWKTQLEDLVRRQKFCSGGQSDCYGQQQNGITQSVCAHGGRHSPLTEAPTRS